MQEATAAYTLFGSRSHFFASSNIKTLRGIPRGEPYWAGDPRVENVLALWQAATYAQRSAEPVPGIHETAYPRLKASVTARDLLEIYTPTPEECAFAASLTRSETARACVVLLLKTFQRLGYFVYVQDVPSVIVSHITAQLGAALSPPELH